MHPIRIWAPVVAAGALSLATQAGELKVADLVDLSLEQLGNIEVTSVSRRAERLADAAASIFVINAEDIRRSGASSLPEVLRLAPNLQVARADNNQYSISARGFNSVLTNKMLVLIDGRTVYSPLFSGVFWEIQDALLEDVERIEVISGPGGAQWGSNAVNGVINVITRSARDTHGTLLALGAGTQSAGAALRYGGQFGADGHYRVYGKHSDRSQSSQANGAGTRDASDLGQVGFRADWGAVSSGFTLQGDAYRSEIDQAVTTRKLSGANLLGRWTRTTGPDESLRVQAYFDRTERDQPGSIRDELTTLDIEVQHGFRLAGSHRILWGGGYRYQSDRVDNIALAALAFLPAERDLKSANVFVQDEIALRADLQLTLGLKLEHNSYTGTEYLPGLRLAWKPSGAQLLWGALSRTVRSPSRIDRELFIPGRPPFVALAGGADFLSEVANVAEVGFRTQPTPNLSFAMSVFHHDFDRLRSLEPSPAGPVFSNRIEGSNKGVEAWGTYRVSNAWRLHAGITQQKVRLRAEPGSASIGGVASLGNDPAQWWTLRSSFDFGPRHEFDLAMRHVGALPNPAVPSYTAVDARLGWRPRRDLEFSATAQNLFDRRHPEWGVAAVRPEFERSVFFKVLWRTQ